MATATLPFRYHARVRSRAKEPAYTKKKLRLALLALPDQAPRKRPKPSRPIVEPPERWR
jgi:hypothetical protein